MNLPSPNKTYFPPIYVQSALWILLIAWKSVAAVDVCSLNLPAPPANDSDGYMTQTWGDPIGAGEGYPISYLKIDVQPGGNGVPTPPIDPGVYAAWCFDVDTPIDPGWGTMYGGWLFSSTDPSASFNQYLPDHPNVKVNALTWKKVNYLLNHREAPCAGGVATAWEFQHVIFLLFGQMAPPSEWGYPEVRQEVIDCLIASANDNAASWDPACGDKVAVIYNIDVNWDELEPDLQLLFLEVPCSCATAPSPGTIGNRVWNDSNANGTQDPWESGVDGVTVGLYRSGDDTLVTTTNTSGGGTYSFSAPAGSYYVKFSGLPTGHVFSPSTASASSDDTDSDANPADGKTDVIVLVSGTNDPNWDAGIYQQATVGNWVWSDANANGLQDSGELGVDGVTVGLYRSTDDTLVGTTTTAGGGIYSFTTAPGTYYLRFSEFPAGFVPSASTSSTTSDNGDSDANPLTGRTDEITLAPGANDPNWDAGIYQPATVGNLVWVDANGNGAQDSGEPGIDGITVELYRDGDDELIGTTTTWDGGQYSFTTVPGSYYLKFSGLPLGFSFSPSTASTDSDSGDSDANAGTGRTDVIALAPGANDANWDAGIYQPVTVGDLVWNDTNANGVQDSGEVGVDGVTVELFRSVDDSLVGTVTTAGGGLYSFTTVPGSYYLKFSGLTSGFVFTSSTASAASDAGDSDATAGTGRTDVIALAPGANDANWDAGIYQPVTVGDLVWNDTNANGIQDSGEVGVDGVTVELFRSVDDSLVGTVTTAGGGLYSFTTVPGSYYLKFSGLTSGFVFTSSTASAASDAGDSDATAGTGRTDVIALAPGANDANWDAGIYQPVTVGDLVWNDTNANGIQDSGEVGVDGVTVELFRSVDDSLVGTVTTAGGGLYSFTTVPGSYYLKFSGLTSGFVFTSSTASAASDAGDSDAIAGTGRTDVIALAPGANDANWDAGIYQPVTVGDLVWNDTNANGVQDSGEVGVDGVTVELFRSVDDSLVGTVTTAGGGLYSFTTVPGSYYLKFSGLTSGFVFTSSTASAASDAGDSDAIAGTGRTDVIALAPGANDANWDAGIYQPVTVGDLVWNDTNANGIQDSGEVGVDGVTVELFRSVDDSLVGTVTTAGGGLYSFTTVPGSYYLKFSGLTSGFVFTSSTASAASDAGDSDAIAGTGRTDVIALAPGANDANWDAGIYQPVTVGDLVWNDTNANGIQDSGEVGVDGVTVELFRSVDDSLVGTVTTAGGGLYSFTTVPGSYYLKFSGLTSGFVFTSSTASAASDAGDSDATAGTGRTDVIALAPGGERRELGCRHLPTSDGR
jgi:hypothetical protein